MNQITVRDGKGAKDRVTVLPMLTKNILTQHLQMVKRRLPPTEPVVPSFTFDRPGGSRALAAAGQRERYPDIETRRHHP